MFIVPQQDIQKIKTKAKQIFEKWIPSGHLVIENTPILNGKETGIRQHFNNVMAKINLKLASHIN